MHSEAEMPVPLESTSHLFSRAAGYFLFIVVLPTVLSIVYYGFFASDVYVAEARYAIRTSSDSPALATGDSLLGAVSAGSRENEDAEIVREYALSRDMLEVLESSLNLRSHYSSSQIDFFSRLTADVSLEQFVEYYRSMVTIDIDPQSNISTLHVRAFDPETARALSENIIRLSEVLVNRMSSRIVEDSLQFAREEVAEAETMVRKANIALTDYRTSSNSIDPAQETSAVLSIITQIESALAMARSDLARAESFMNPNSVQVKNLRSHVHALEKQSQRERQRLSAENGNSRDYTRLIDGYEPLLLEKTLAEQRWASALDSLEAARTESQRQQRYLIAFVTPKLPDEAVEPDRPMAVAGVFVATLLVYAIGGLVWAAIKDHMRI